MTIEKAMLVLIGTMVLVTSLLALFHNPLWTWVTVFVGFNVLQSAFTGFCPPSWVMKKMGMKTQMELSASH